MRAASVDEMAQDPVGRYVAGKGYAHFCAHPRLWGVLLWGRPNQEDAFRLGRTLVLELAAPAVPHVSIVDASRIEGVDAGAFGTFDGYVRQNMEALSKQVTRLALVRPPGMEGAFVAGFFEVLPRPYPVAVFVDAAEALAWLDEDDCVEDPPPSHFGAALEDIVREVVAMPAIISELRGVLEANLHDITVADTAKALGVSERTLQRRLREAGTTFQDEVGAARLRAAQRMLLDSDAALTNIALEVGCASLQHFSALFRKLTGESPSAWRTRMTRGSD
jgi:AraC-like DNA-binding protein